ncbi:hypothetical protein [Mitsuokella sp. oral taxon 131]|uniref:hypothetical protein n=1 Tax=Mitsuokella sp. oral taxon 131 TaxID=1321780 RepID=UPI0003AE743C|nr:hypothetical protein [Mitsuokella sp. oral taxon 131]ERL25261.1 hypothetical protein HMPREF1985_00320 [Mitsuokella sp. oral taxon 131 str. W9106]
MLNMDTKLAKRQEEGKVIRTGIVGAGQMGRGMVTQMALMKGIMPAIVSDIKMDNVIHAFHYAGISDDQIAVAETLEEANKYMEMGKFVATDHSDIIAQANLVECAIDVTGVPEVGVKIATDALKNHKHVVMMDVETDVVIGSYLKKLGDQNGVIYTGSAGDEPGAVMELYSFAKAMGMQVKVITIDGIGGYTTYGSIATAEETYKNGYVVYGLVNKKTRMLKDVRKGQLLTLDMVELDTSTQLYQTRKMQDRMYHNGYALK